ncbi:MAG: 4'-phosphopantetheinyl transferase superfamily protein [Desulfuromonadaceae bacterium]|nr:4'-phosphopantetheinyl transferase superfamily protein [Desulfuromonadaceae bacterium]
MLFPWPQENEVHIHRASPGTETVRHVSSDEISRAGCLFDADKKNRFLACRGLLREILGGYLGIPPEDVYLAVGEHGKPYLSTTAANKEQLHFNLAHSGPMFLLAIATDRDVGIDLEQMNNDIPYPDMAQLAFSSHEQKELFNLPQHQQLAAFYRCWTRKEAYLKACGSGFAIKSNSFDVSLLAETPAVLIEPGKPPNWLLVDISVPETYCAALAVHGSTPIIRYID